MDFDCDSWDQVGTGAGVSNGGSTGMTCHKCGEVGHMSRECSSGGGGGSRACFKCHEEGHLSRDCPTGGGGGGGSRACFKCNEEGHLSRDCPTGGSGGGGGSSRACFKCHEEGHLSRDCPTGGSGGGGGPRTCHKCGAEDHMARECPTGGSNSATRGACFKCKKEGHMSRDCPEAGGEGTTRGTGCHRCSEEGHMAKDCPNKPSGEGDVGADGKPRERYTPADFADGEGVFEDRNATHSGSGINFDQYDAIPVQVTGDDVPPSVNSFADLELRPLLCSNIEKCGYQKPTPIQRYATPVLAAQRDVMACAQTGSGKSCAFLLPILNNFMKDPDLTPPSTAPATPEALILAPTRELAIQICKDSHTFGQGSIVKTRVAYGGTTLFSQRNLLLSGCNILVATPGRLLQFMNEGHVDLKKVKFFILDEADRMLDMGFMSDINKIVEKMPPKGSRVSGMFSATFPVAIQDVARQFLKNYVFISVGIVGGACRDVHQEFFQIERKEKRDKLIDILKQLGKDEKVLIFCGSKKGADFLASTLSTHKFSSTSIHGDRLQSQRELALNEFTNGTRKILVATSVAARGLDIPRVNLVINYDLPAEVDEYVHRIGRTGRVGNVGRAISFFDPTGDASIAPALKKILTDAEQVIPDWMDGVSTGGFDLDDFGGVDVRGGGSNFPTANASGAAGGDLEAEEDW